MDFKTACTTGDIEKVHSLYSNTISADVLHNCLYNAIMETYSIDVVFFLLDKLGSKYNPHDYSLFCHNEYDFINMVKMYYDDHIVLLNKLGTNPSDVVPLLAPYKFGKSFELTINKNNFSYKSVNHDVSSNIKDVILFSDMPFLGVGIAKIISKTENKIVCHGRLIKYEQQNCYWDIGSETWVEYYKEHNRTKILRKQIMNISSF